MNDVITLSSSEDEEFTPKKKRAKRTSVTDNSEPVLVLSDDENEKKYFESNKKKKNNSIKSSSNDVVVVDDEDEAHLNETVKRSLALKGVRLIKLDNIKTSKKLNKRKRKIKEPPGNVSITLKYKTKKIIDNITLSDDEEGASDILKSEETENNKEKTQHNKLKSNEEYVISSDDNTVETDLLELVTIKVLTVEKNTEGNSDSEKNNLLTDAKINESCTKNSDGGLQVSKEASLDESMETSSSFTDGITENDMLEDKNDSNQDQNLSDNKVDLNVVDEDVELNVQNQCNNQEPEQIDKESTNTASNNEVTTLNIKDPSNQELIDNESTIEQSVNEVIKLNVQDQSDHVQNQINNESTTVECADEVIKLNVQNQNNQEQIVNESTTDETIKSNIDKDLINNDNNASSPADNTLDCSSFNHVVPEEINDRIATDDEKESNKENSNSKKYCAENSTDIVDENLTEHPAEVNNCGSELIEENNSLNISSKIIDDNIDKSCVKLTNESNTSEIASETNNEQVEKSSSKLIEENNISEIPTETKTCEDDDVDNNSKLLKINDTIGENACTDAVEYLDKSSSESSTSSELIDDKQEESSSDKLMEVRHCETINNGTDDYCDLFCEKMEEQTTSTDNENKRADTSTDKILEELSSFLEENDEASTSTKSETENIARRQIVNDHNEPSTSKKLDSDDEDVLDLNSDGDNSQCISNLSSDETIGNEKEAKEKLDSFFDICKDMIKQTKYEKLEKTFSRMLKKHEMLISSQIELEEYINLLENCSTEASKSLQGTVFSIDKLLNFFSSVEVFDAIDVPVENERKIKKLYKLCLKLIKRIKKLEETEVDFDDEDNSAYIMEDRYKARLVKVFNMYCKVANINPRTGLGKKIQFVSSDFNEINMAINKKYKGCNLFPNYSEIKKLVENCTKEHDLPLNDSKIQSESKKCFKALGELLQKQRKLNLYQDHYHFIKDSMDPANNDTSLRSILKQNFDECSAKIDSICKKYVQKQEEGKEVELSEDSDNSNHISSSDDDND